jgi:hypothetical protein
MPSAKEPVRANVQRGRSDLSKEYRPIGIGAVAAALTVTGKHEPEAEQSVNARTEHDREIQPIAA